MSDFHMTRRRLLGTGATIGAAGLLAACGQAQMTGGEAAPAVEETSTEAAQPETMEVVNLVYASPESPARQEKEIAIFDDFNAQHSNIQVEVAGQAGGWRGVYEKFMVAHAGGVSIDFVHNGWLTWDNMWRTGAILDQAEFFKSAKLVPGELFIESSLFEWVLDGVLGGMPISTSSDAMAYNKDMFAEAGLQEPPVDTSAKWWNMDTFLDYAQKLTNEEQFGFGGSLGGGNAAGETTGTYFGQGPWDDVNRVAFIDSPGIIQGLEFWRDVTEVKYHVQPNPDEHSALRGGQRMNVFVTGNIGMQVSFINQDTNFNWAAGTLPYDGDGPSRSARISNHGLQMGNAATQDAVWTVFTWFMTPENAGRFPRTAGHVVSPFTDPAFSEVSQAVFRNQLGIDPKAYFLQAQQTQPHGWGMLKYSAWEKIRDQARPRYREEYQLGKVDTREYAEWFQKLITDEMNEYFSNSG